MLAVTIAGDSRAQQSRKLVFFFGSTEGRRVRGRSTGRAKRGEAAEFVGGGGHQAHSRSRIASAASFACGARSPAGPTQDGQPASHAQARMSSRVFCTRSSWTRKSGSEKPKPPGYAS